MSGIKYTTTHHHFCLECDHFAVKLKKAPTREDQVFNILSAKCLNCGHDWKGEIEHLIWRNKMTEDFEAPTPGQSVDFERELVQTLDRLLDLERKQRNRTESEEKQRQEVRLRRLIEEADRQC